MERINHLNHLCPICGNSDFIQIKKEGKSRVSDIEDKLEIYGCTKCHYLIYFNKNAVAEAFEIEKRKERLFQEIDGIKKELVRLEEECHQDVVRLNKLIEINAPENEINGLRDIIENDTKQRIVRLKTEIEILEDEDKENCRLPIYSSQDYSISLHEDQIQELRKRIENVIEVLESISNHLNGDPKTDSDNS